MKKIFHHIDYFSSSGKKKIPLEFSTDRPLCRQSRAQIKYKVTNSHIKCQVHRVHMQRGVFTHCSFKTQLGYHCVPLSELLYPCQYLASCINGCCVKPANCTGSAEERVNAKTEKKRKEKKGSTRIIVHTRATDLPVQVKA